ncbi:MAG: glycosyltransferase family 2 protein, partial [Bacillota bacterium]|nr:glycosyltransferase family 2 protein [Bacillota bacterium]
MKVVTIIPANNEEKTITEVVKACKAVEIIDEVIVVSDGSVDKTAFLANIAGAKVIDLPENIGKGGAMMTGVNNTDGDVILFLDADLIGLTASHIKDLLLPVITDEVDMTVGIFDHGRLATDLAQVIAPYLSGQRALKKSLLLQMSNLDVTRFGVEVALTRYASEHNIKVKKIVLSDMSHVMKEEKLGLVKGFAARMK